MKKILLAAFAALAITSCTQNEEFEGQNSNNEINFNTGVSNATRGAVLVNDDFVKFITYAYVYADDFTADGASTLLMDSAQYTRTKGELNWSAGEIYYWPIAGKVTFFGYGGLTGTTATYAKNGTAMPTLNYEVGTTIADQEDLVIAQTRDAKKGEGNASVGLKFKHALTQVYFKLKVADTNLNYDVTNITIGNVKNKGVFTYADATTSATSFGAWDVTTGSKTQYSIGLNQNITSATTTPVELIAKEQIMMLLPQALNGITISVNYTAKKGETIVHNGVTTWTFDEVAGSWASGQKIAYVITLSGDNEMTVTGEVDDNSWTPKDPAGTDVK